MTDAEDPRADAAVEGGRKQAGEQTSRWEGGSGAPETAAGGAEQDGKSEKGAAWWRRGVDPIGTTYPSPTPLRPIPPPHPPHTRSLVWVGLLQVSSLTHLLQSTPMPCSACEGMGGRELLRRPRTRHDSHTIVASTRARSRSTNLSIYLKRF